MNNTNIGAIIAALRYKKRYSRKKLCQGLCSIPMLIKIENDETDVDKFLVDMLLQRLGKSTDKLEVILSDEEYERIHIRDYIEELIWKQKKDEAISLLNKYEKQYAKDSNVQKMFVLRTKAYISSKLEKDVKLMENYILQAIETTLPGINSKNMGKYLLAESEIENMLMLSQCFLELGKCEEAEELMTICQKYIDINVTDEVEYAKLNSKSSWLRADFFIKKGAYIEAYQICEKAMEWLRKYGILYFMLPLLEQLVFCSEQLQIDINRSKWKIYNDILIQLYCDYGKPWYCHDSLFHNCYQTVYHLASEFIRQERLARALTQEQLIEGVYGAPENLSRIEHGKSVPTRKKFEGLMENLGVERGKYCGTAIVENFEVLELKYEIDILIGTGKYDKAQEKLNQLRGLLNYEKKINCMAVEVYQSMLDIGCGRINANSLYEKLMLLLEESSLLRNGKLYRVPFYNELLVLNMICSSLRKMEKIEKSVIIYEEIIRVIEESRVDARYQNNILSLVLANIDLMDSNRKWSNIGISYELFCGKGNMIYMHFVSQIELEENEKTRRKITRLAYYMSDLFFREVNKQRIKKYYEQTYGEELL